MAALASGCVLFVPFADPGGAHCKVAGADTACGTCIAAECIDLVDACCFDDKCGGIVKDVETCSTKNDATCDRLQSVTDSAGVHHDLSACVSSKCKDVCAAVATGSLTKCTPAYVTSVDACSCEESTTPNNVVCTTVDHPKLRCCAPHGWPGPALACNCLSISCATLGDGCQCELTGIDDQGRAALCKGDHCCIDSTGTMCSCGSRACLVNQTAVPTCTIDQLGCGDGEDKVDTCSARKP